MNHPAPIVNPFPGLRPFLAHEKHLFFGRERQVAELVERLAHHRFLAVVGTSGSGKSSLVRAGLLPELHGGNLVSAGTRWEVLVLRPGSSPIHNLAQAFLEANLYDPAAADAGPALVATLSHSRFGLLEAARQSDLPAGTNLLVIVDQFEEIFRFHNELAHGDEHAADFVNLLLEATRQDQIPIYVALTMRSDFLGDCAQFAGLAEAVNHGEYLIPRLGRDQCRLAIEGPVRVAGGSIAPRLTQRLLNEIGDNPDQLPVLQHALMRTWDHWARTLPPDATPVASPIDLADYEAIGTMAEALSRHADEVFASLENDRQRQLAERLFKALTQRGADGRGVRRPARIDHLAEILEAPTAEILPVIETFRAPGRTFLMPMQPAALTPATVVDIAHESLMRVWRRLHAWVEQEAQSARIYRRLADTASLQAAGQAGLYRDPDLQIALSWRDQEMPNAAWAALYHSGFASAMAFLTASAEAARAEATAQEAARARELEQARALADAERQRAELQALHAGRLRLLVRGLGLALMLALTATLAAFIARNAARVSEQAAVIKEQLARASEARAQAATRRAEALQLEASRLAYASAMNLAQGLLDSERHSEAEQVLTESFPNAVRGWEYGYLQTRLAQRGRVIGKTGGGFNATWALTFSPDSRRIAFTETRPEAVIYDIATAAITLRVDLAARHGLQEIQNFRYSPDGRLLAVAGARGPTSGTNLWLLDAATGTTLRGLPVTFPVVGLAFSPDGRRLAAGGVNADALLLDVATGRIERRFSGHGDVVANLAFTPDGKKLITATGHLAPNDPNRESTARVWDVASGRLLLPMTFHKNGIFSLAVHPSAPLVATSSWNRDLRIWNYEIGLEQFADEPAGNDVPNGLAFTPDGRILLVGGENSDGTFSARAVESGTILARPKVHERWINTMALSPDGSQLATASFDGTVRLHDLRMPTEATPLRAHRTAISALAISPDGNRVASAAADRTLHIHSLQDWRLIAQISLDRPVSALAFNTDGSALFVPATNGETHLLPVTNGPPLQRYPTGRNATVHRLATSPDGQTLAVLGTDGYVTLFDAATTAIRWQHQAHLYTEDDYPPALAMAIRFSPDGQRIATAGIDRTVRILDARTGEELDRLEDSVPIRDVVFSADNRSVITTGGDDRDSLLIRWDLASRKAVRRAQALEKVRSIALTADGTRLLTLTDPAATDQSQPGMRLWEPESLRVLVGLGHTNRALSAAFAAANGMLLSADLQGNLRVFASQTNSPSPTPSVQDPPTTQETAFHLALRPVVGRTQAGIVAKPMPRRLPQSPPELLDLDSAANATPTFIPRSVATQGLEESQLAHLPTGLQRVDGVLFDVRGLAAVANSNSAPTLDTATLPTRVQAIPLNRTFHRLHALLVLLAPRNANTPRAAVGYYTLHYADSTIARIPIHEGIDVLSGVVAARETGVPARDHLWPVWSPDDSFTRPTHAVFTNPSPDKIVRHIDFEIAPQAVDILATLALTLETTPTPRFVQQPTRQRVAPGQPAEFHASAESSIPVRYQWQHDDQDIPGATNATLRLPAVNATHVGLYRVALSTTHANDIVRVCSSPAPLELEEPTGIRGRLRLEFFEGIPTKFLTNFTQHPKFPDRPDRVLAVHQLALPHSDGTQENYGARVSGHLLPPTTGDYTFYVAADDQCQLWLSTDDSPANKQLIAREDYWQSPRAWVAARRRVGTTNISKPIRLEAGKRYYVEALFKEGAVLDHMAVTWRLPGQPVPENGSPPIPARYLASPDFTPTP